ncbi:MAG: VTT domain-containing protein [Spirochaetia bacterium]|nr:VTT domain-containing protein [Spirochaetia bacterium]
MNKKNFSRLLLFILTGTAITFAFIYREYIHADQLQQWVEEAGPVGPVLFMILYIIATPLFIPGSIFALAGGALFGPVMGTSYNLTAATIGAIISFFLSRHIASDWVEKKSGGFLKRLIQGVEQEGWKFVAFVRLVPLFPFNLLNYALGLTKISFLQYSIATYICMFPGALAYTYLGYAGKEAAAGGEDLIQKGLIALALLATAAFLPRFIMLMRKKPMVETAELKKRLNEKEDFLLLDVRSQKEHDGELGFIPESRHIPLEELEERIRELDAFSEKPILTICTVHTRSSKAAGLLSAKGFADVRAVRGGMKAWNGQ